jgi:hypothetical protein
MIRLFFVAMFVFLGAGCEDRPELDPLVGRYEMFTINGEETPSIETQVDSNTGVSCDVSKLGAVSVSPSLSFSLLIQELKICSDSFLSQEGANVVDGGVFEIEPGLEYQLFFNSGDFNCVLDDVILKCEGQIRDQSFSFEASKI